MKLKKLERKKYILEIFALVLVITTLVRAYIDIREIIKLQTVEKKEYITKKYKVLSYSSPKEHIKQAVIEEFGHEMAEIVGCESGFKLKAFNPHNRNGSTDSGLFQINSVHRKEAKRLGIDLDTIEGQFKYAKILVQKNGYRDWVCAKKLGIVK